MSKEAISHGQPFQDMERWREAGRGSELIEAKHRAASIKKVVQDRGMRKLLPPRPSKGASTAFSASTGSCPGTSSPVGRSTIRWRAVSDSSRRYGFRVHFRSQFGCLHTLEQHKRERGETSPGDTFVLLELDPSVLYELELLVLPDRRGRRSVSHQMGDVLRRAGVGKRVEDGQKIQSPGGGYSPHQMGLEALGSQRP